MLLINKNFKITYVNTTAICFGCFLSFSSCYLIADFFNLNSTTLFALSVPLGLVGSFLFEISISKKGRVFDDSGLEYLFTRINEGKDEEVKAIIEKFLLAKKKSRIVINTANRKTLDEIELLAIIIYTSFHKENSYDYSEKVYSLIQKIDIENSTIGQEYNVEVNDILFLHSQNCNYLYHYFGFKSQIQNSLKPPIRSDFFTISFLSSDSLLNLANKNDTITNMTIGKYRDMVYRPIRNFQLDDNMKSGEDLTVTINLQPDLNRMDDWYRYYLSVKDNDSLSVLKYSIAYKVIASGIGALVTSEKANHDRILSLIKEMKDLISEHQVLNFFLDSSLGEKSDFISKYDEFRFSSNLDSTIHLVLINEINDSILCADQFRFNFLFSEWKSRKSETFIVLFFNKVYEEIELFFFENKIPEFRDLKRFARTPELELAAELLPTVNWQNTKESIPLLIDIFQRTVQDSLFSFSPVYRFFNYNEIKENFFQE